MYFAVLPAGRVTRWVQPSESELGIAVLLREVLASDEGVVIGPIVPNLAPPRLAPREHVFRPEPAPLPMVTQDRLPV
ncbi:MAG: hypothetical protein M3082_03465 [Candidatus Dormibacteraeota bacterium]|nr:hypothetical protein [Candidatus Dormibacteraeota bacterium]